MIDAVSEWAVDADKGRTKAGAEPDRFFDLSGYRILKRG